MDTEITKGNIIVMLATLIVTVIFVLIMTSGDIDLAKRAAVDCMSKVNNAEVCSK